jgi:MFS family permease
MFSWALRYVLFAYGDLGPSVWMLYVGIILHGICYDFFFVTGQIYVDNKAGEKIKAAAQGLITFATYGVGMFIGSYISGEIVELYTSSQAGEVVQRSWESIWLIPAVLSGAVLVLFMIFFNEKKKVELPEEVTV